MDTERPLEGSTVPAVPCCLELSPSVECRTSTNYDTKCGFSAAPGYGEGSLVNFAGPPALVYRTMSGSFTTEVEYTWTEPDQTISGTCTTTFSASCEGGSGEPYTGTARFVWSAELPGDVSIGNDETTTGTGVPAGELTDEGRILCITFDKIMRGGRAPYLIPHQDAAWDGGEMITATGATAGTCQSFTITYTQTLSGPIVGGGTYTEHSQVNGGGELTLCDLFTTAELIALVEGDLTVGEWEAGYDCCAANYLPPEETSYSYTKAEFRITFTEPCDGTAVNLLYDQSINGAPATTETVANVHTGHIVTITPPAIGEDAGGGSNVVCLSNFRLVYA